MTAKYRLFGTTADVGVVSYGADVPRAFENQARGMFSVMADMRRVRPRLHFTVEASGPDLPGLLASWLEELLFIFDTRRVLLRGFSITKLDGLNLKGEAWGEEIDPARHVMKTPVKAVTYHMLEVTGTDGGIRTKVVYDI